VGALSPEKGGALRKQSTQGRRIGIAAVLCGGLFGVPLLLLQNGPAHAARVTSADGPVVTNGTLPAGKLDDVDLPSHLVAYQRPASTTSTTTAPSAAPAAAPVEEAAAEPAAPHVVETAPEVAPVSDTQSNSEVGQATWYSEAAPGYCASHTLPRGTVLTVRNDATGATTTCTVDDYEAAGYPRVVDMSYSGFSQIADPNQGVADVTISW
jgi:rare lipoprotein A (peptidoglycan hydrolase)